MEQIKLDWKYVKISAIQCFNSDNYYYISQLSFLKRKIAGFQWEDEDIIAYDENNKPILLITKEAISHVYYE